MHVLISAELFEQKIFTGYQHLPIIDQGLRMKNIDVSLVGVVLSAFSFVDAIAKLAHFSQVKCISIVCFR
jgi:hypothetical protein